MSVRLPIVTFVCLSATLTAVVVPATVPARQPAGTRPTVPLEVKDPWVRASLNPRNTAAYMTLTNPTDREVVIVSASSPAARVVEMHEVAMEGAAMRMRRVERIAVPAHGTTSLAPGGRHLMLIDLPRPLAAGERIAIVLRLADGRELEIEAPVRSAATR